MLAVFDRRVSNSSALSDCLVYGAASGEDAAAFSKNLGSPLPLDRAAVAAARDKIGGWLARRGADPGEVLDRLSALAFRHLNMVRTGPGLRAALDEVADLKKNVLPTLSADGDAKARPIKLRQAIEAEGQSGLCELMATAALTREESRGGFFGGHYRVEFPDRDDANWLKTVVLAKAGEGIAVNCEQPVALGELSSEINSVIATAWRPPNDPAHFAEAE